MNEWKNSSTIGKISLDDFLRRIKGNKYRLKRLEEELEWTIHKMFSVPGPVYDRIGTPSNVHPAPFIYLLDKEFEIKKKIQRIYDEEALLRRFERTLAARELDVLQETYFHNKTQLDIALRMGVSQQCVSQYLDKTRLKWHKWCEE